MQAGLPSNLGLGQPAFFAGPGYRPPESFMRGLGFRAPAYPGLGFRWLSCLRHAQNLP